MGEVTRRPNRVNFRRRGRPAGPHFDYKTPETVCCLISVRIQICHSNRAPGQLCYISSVGCGLQMDSCFVFVGIDRGDGTFGREKSPLGCDPTTRPAS
ncbi:hypothetical protein GWI33_003205 [Rhynchophorus ferrugineus]|uniref:Uncharacterized protein n=1 Tax=Rhynchophorus ferrugineus TaxID=354439 RepID=A0A834IV71_RHYFE|nr:hypothetical protein GWI33_003205 [Rhynchophorus ferrugineus]